jgi:hypothetical protein
MKKFLAVGLSAALMLFLAGSLSGCAGTAAEADSEGASNNQSCHERPARTGSRMSSRRVCSDDEES